MPSRSSENLSRPLMKKVSIGFVVIVLVAAIGYWGNKAVQSHLGQSALDASGLQVLSLENALKQAKDSDKLVLADMSAIWCPTCRRLDKEVFSNELVKAELTKNYLFARVEYETVEGEEFRKTYKVSGFPTLLILDSDAKKLTQLPLVFEPSTFVENLRKVIRILEQ